ncbi:MAG: MFS transporter [Anaerolineae bacterium]|nr:MFS transporter [Anaerolineae bacterium]
MVSQMQVHADPKRRHKIASVYLSGLLVGISLILFPAAGPLFTDPTLYALDATQFGLLFTPQIVMAVVASSLTATLAGRYGMKWVIVIGMVLTALAMLLLVMSNFLIGVSNSAFICLLAATAAIGAGFGFTISALNAYAFDLFPGKEDSAVTAVHVMTGIGQVGAALILSLFMGLNIWWGAPLTIAVTVAVMISFLLTLPLKLSAENEAPAAMSHPASDGRLSGRIWLFAVVTFTYGAIEGTFGNWTPIYLETSAQLSAAQAVVGLSLFWAAVTGGRVIFALLAVRLNLRPVYAITPFVVGVIFILLPALGGPIANYGAIIIAGLALSFYFPYSVSLASAESPALTAAVSGLLVAGLQLGNGISANIVGLLSQSIDLATIFRLSAAYAVVMAVIVIYLGLSAARKNSAPGMNDDLPCLVLPCVQHQTRDQQKEITA